MFGNTFSKLKPVNKTIRKDYDSNRMAFRKKAYEVAKSINTTTPKKPTNLYQMSTFNSFYTKPKVEVKKKVKAKVVYRYVVRKRR